MADGGNLVQPLSALRSEDLLGILMTILDSRHDVLQAVVSWALPTRCYAPVQMLTECRFHGAVKDGEIICPQLLELFGCNAIIDGSRSRSLVADTTVTFAVCLDEEQKPHVFDVSAVDTVWSDLQVDAGAFEKPVEPAWSPQIASSPQIAFSVPAITDRRFEGTLVSWNETGEFGFINCSEVSTALGIVQDVYVHSTQRAGFNVGQRVSFGVYLSRDNRPQANDLRAAGPRQGAKRPFAGPVELPRVAPAALQSLLAQPAMQPCVPRAPDAPRSLVDMPGVTDRLFVGTIIAYSDSGGFGFILNEELKEMFGKDVFLHSAQRAGFEVGQQVRFGVFLNKNGKPSAKNLTNALDPPQTDAPPTSVEMPGVTDRSFVGTVLSFNDQLGFGFIQCMELKSRFPGDVFLHRAQRAGFDTGSVVAFEVFLNKDGKPQAKNLRATGTALL